MPVRSKSASLRASTLSLLLPSFNKAFRRGLQTRTCCTCGCSRSYSQAAQVPSSQVTCSSPRRPWINCRMLLALVSRMVSMTSFPLPIQDGDHNRFLVHVHSDIFDVVTHLSCLLGGRVFLLTLIFPLKVKMPFSRRFAYVLLQSFRTPFPMEVTPNRRRSGGAATHN